MRISNKGLIELMGHEGVCLSPYLDSADVWTIGVGVTSHDNLDVKNMGPISLQKAIELYRNLIPNYTKEVDRLGLDLNQTQYDALSSFCYNCGPGNLRKLAKGRSVNAIGTALMLYLKPKEITARRQKEQKLYQYGQYSNGGKVLVFPVSKNHRPIYGKGYQIDASAYFATPPAPVKTPVAPLPPAANITTDKTPPEGLSLWSIWEWLKNH